MLRALLYLRLVSLQNVVRSRLLRLRQPKYLTGALAGLAYFWFFFFRHLFGAGHRGALTAPVPALPEPADLVAAFGVIGSAALLVLFVLSWVLPGSNPGLGFTEPEIAFLFPAPVSRRTLIHFKLASAQFRIFFTSLFFTLISSRWNFLGGNALTHAIGWWVILSATSLHYTGATLVITVLRHAGRGVALRRGSILGGVVALGIASWLWARHILPTPEARDFASLHAFMNYLAPLTEHGFWAVLLWPGKLLVAPFLAPDFHAFLPEFGFALLPLAALYLWVARTDAAFEEDSIAGAEKRARLVSAAREGRYVLGGATAKARRAPFRLSGTGRPESAFLWKNLLSTRPYFSLRVLLGSAAMLVAINSILRRVDAYAVFAPILGTLALIVAGYTLLLGPQLARMDFRSDLAHADILKTYPVAGWQLVFGQLLTPTLILSGLVWLAGLEWTLAFELSRFPWLTFSFRAMIAVCVGLTAVPLVMLQVFVPNAATLLFPGWFHATRGRAGGIDVVGQRLIFVFGQFLTTLLALIPAVLAAGLALVCTFGWRHLISGESAHFLSPGGLVLATFLALAVLGAELWCGIWWLGRRFERFDLSSELRA